MASGGHKRRRTEDEEVCKDFLRGRCGFRANCKYYHPPGQEGTVDPGDYEDEGGGKRKLIFCKDFQSDAGCAWPVCRFIHCTKQEEREFVNTKNVTEKLAYAILVAGQGDKKDIGGREVCMDFLMGRCSRDFDKCRHLHVDPDKVMTASMRDRDLVGNERVCLDFLRGVCDRPNCRYSHNSNASQEVDPFNPPADVIKRNQANRRGMARGGSRGGGMAGSNYDSSRMGGVGPSGYGGGYAPVGPGFVSGGGAASGGGLAEQNAFLQQTVSRLKVQVATLLDEKQELMEQNTRLQTKVQKLVGQMAAGESSTGMMGGIGVGMGVPVSSGANYYDPAVPTGVGRFDTDF